MRAHTIHPGAAAMLCAALATGCAPPGPGEIRYETGQPSDETVNGLYLVKPPWGVNARVFVKPGADLERYDQVLLAPVEIRYLRATTRKLTPEQSKVLEGVFRSSLLDQLRKSTVYRVAQAPGPKVIRLQASLVDLDVTAPNPNMESLDTTVFVASAGAVTGLLELSDSETGEMLVMAAEREQVSNVGGAVLQNSGTANLANARTLFDNWALRLRGWLDHVREIPPLPAGD
jgi:hypothetical protein